MFFESFCSFHSHTMSQHFFRWEHFCGVTQRKQLNDLLRYCSETIPAATYIKTKLPQQDICYYRKEFSLAFYVKPNNWNFGRRVQYSTFRREMAASIFRISEICKLKMGSALSGITGEGIVLIILILITACI